MNAGATGQTNPRRQTRRVRRAAKRRTRKGCPDLDFWLWDVELKAARGGQAGPGGAP